MHAPLQLASNEDQRIVAGAAVDVIGRQDAEINRSATATSSEKLDTAVQYTASKAACCYYQALPMLCAQQRQPPVKYLTTAARQSFGCNLGMHGSGVSSRHLNEPSLPMKPLSCANFSYSLRASAVAPVCPCFSSEANDAANGVPITYFSHASCTEPAANVQSVTTSCTCVSQ
eukprot:12374-Heterococcus_DN1.PRE.8